MSRGARTWMYAMLFGCLLVPAIMFGQGFQTGTLTADVKDSSGAVLPGVTVTITSQERGTQRTAVTDGSGRASFPVLQLGFYTVEATLSGFDTARVKDNRVTAEKTTNVDVTLRMAATTQTITVTGTQPVIDPTNVTATTQISTREYEKLPVARSYQGLLAIAPGVVDQPGNSSGGNPQVHGATNSSNVYLFDGVDTTDTTTGTFGSNMNFEAIQEVNIQTAGMSAEYGRGTGAVMNVITKSGTNSFAGSLKAVQTNDSWNGPNRTHNQVTGASLARKRQDHNNYDYFATLGGPVWRDHIWFFGAYEQRKDVTAAATTTVTNEQYQARRTLKMPNYRLTAQITPTQTVWAKYGEDPFSGIIRDYWGGAPELFSLTAQSQGGKHKTVQYSGVFGQNMTAEAMWADSSSRIDVSNYSQSSLLGGAPIYNYEDGNIYNSGPFAGFVDRPRTQYVANASYFTPIFGGNHDFKAGIDYQNLKSSNSFIYPGLKFYYVDTFNPATRAYTPVAYEDYGCAGCSGPSTSKGTITALYLRDKFDVSRRAFLELGLRYEKEMQKNDLGEKVFDQGTIAPRIQASFDILGDSRTLAILTAGRMYQSVIQNFADTFAGVPQQTNYDQYTWDGSKYVLTDQVRLGGSALQPNLSLDAPYVDEFTLGVQQQLGSTMGVTFRYIDRKFKRNIDDVLSFDSKGAITQNFVNLSAAKRKYNGFEFTFDKRFANNWNLLANWTHGKTTGNYFASGGDVSSQQGNFVNAQCKTTVDPTIGNNGVISCADVLATQSGRPSWDIPDIVNVLGGYTFGLGPVNLAAGGGLRWSAGNAFGKNRATNVVNPVTGATTTRQITYYYEGAGSDRGPNYYTLDGSLEATWTFMGVALGLKGEVFNITDQQKEVVVSNTTWCGDASAAASSPCGTARARYGTFTARGSFQAPRSFRLTSLIRF